MKRARLSRQLTAFVLLAGCSTFAAADWTRGQAAWSLTGMGNILEPFRAAAVEKIPYSPEGTLGGGYVYPTRPTDQLIVVYFLIKSGTVSAKDIDWVVRGHDGKDYNPIGIGINMMGGDFFMLGQLKSGDLNLSWQTNSIVGLIFVIPKGEVNARLMDPQKYEDQLRLSEGWSPGTINAITGVSLDSVIQPPHGEGWEWRVDIASISLTARGNIRGRPQIPGLTTA